LNEELGEERLKRIARHLEGLGVVKVGPEVIRITTEFLVTVLRFIAEAEKREDLKKLIEGNDDNSLATITMVALLRHCGELSEDDLFDATEFLCRLAKSAKMRDMARSMTYIS